MKALVDKRLQEMSARAPRVMPYGAFARVADGVEGLIHVSELASVRVGCPCLLASRGRTRDIVRKADTAGPERIIGTR